MMRNPLLYTGIALGLVTLTSGDSVSQPPIADAVVASAITDEEITIVYDRYAAGSYRLVMTINADRSATIRRITGARVDVDGRPITPDSPDDPEEPEDPPADAPDYSAALKQVEDAFVTIGIPDTFLKQRAALRSVLFVGTGSTPATLWNQTQTLISQPEVLGQNVPQWRPWVRLLTESVEVPGIGLDTYKVRLKSARDSLGD